jgi:NAD+ synthase
VPVEVVAQAMGLNETQVQRAFNDFSRKQRSTDYLRMPTIFLGD